MAMRRHQRPAVVVVDDDPDIVDVVCAALTDEGFTTMGVTRAAEAFWHIQRSQPHLVILDVHMPEVDGLAVLEQIRADPHTAALPVLFLTAYSDLVRRHMVDYQARGAELLPKPFQIDTLIAMVKRILGR